MCRSSDPVIACAPRLIQISTPVVSGCGAEPASQHRWLPANSSPGWQRTRRRLRSQGAAPSSKGWRVSEARIDQEVDRSTVVIASLVAILWYPKMGVRRCDGLRNHSNMNPRSRGVVVFERRAVRAPVRTPMATALQLWSRARERGDHGRSADAAALCERALNSLTDDDPDDGFDRLNSQRRSLHARILITLSYQ